MVKVHACFTLVVSHVSTLRSDSTCIQHCWSPFCFTYSLSAWLHSSKQGGLAEGNSSHSYYLSSTQENPAAIEMSKTMANIAKCHTLTKVLSQAIPANQYQTQLL